MDFSRTLYYLMGFINRFMRFIKYNKKLVMFIVVFLCVFLGLKHYGFCDWTDGDIYEIQEGLSTITSNQGVLITQLQELGLDTSQLSSELTAINSKLNSVVSNTNITASNIQVIESELSDIYNRLYTLSIDINNKLNILQSTIESNQSQLIQQLQTDNSNLLNSLNNIQDILQGNETSENINVTRFDNLTFDTDRTFHSAAANRQVYSFKYDKTKTYKITVSDNSTTSGSWTTRFGLGNSLPSLDVNIPILIGSLTSSGGSVYTFTVNSGYNYEYVYIRAKSYITYSVEEITGNVGFSGIQDSINSQGQNINNSITDDNINSSAQDLPNNDTVDITSDGFNNVFNILYNTFTSSSSVDLVLPLPFVNKTITINYANVFGNFAGGFIFTLANTFWYYVISVYIVKDIYSKIYAIKSGNIENVENTNIKEDLL